jgi:hypothetical protein
MVATNGASVTELDSRHVKFRVVGTQSFNDRVLAAVFARKLALLIRAMEAADRSANGGKRFEYVITNLTAASPATATLAEQQIGKHAPQFSSVDTFGRCAQAINAGDESFARRHIECATYLAAVAKDAEKSFDHSELTVNGYAAIRIDQFFFNRAKEIVGAKEREEKPTWFRGEAIGTFDGEILEVDLRGDIPKVILRLTSGGKEIDCVCPGLDVEDIRKVLDRRVEVTGRAFYDGRSGLPARIELTRVPTPVRTGVDFSRWKGALGHDGVAEWGGDD